MKTKSHTFHEEAGWEFTVPAYVASLFTWILIAVIVIILFLVYTRMNRSASNTVRQQVMNMPSTQSQTQK